MSFHSTLNVENQLIEVEGAQTPAGGRDREDPAGIAEEASGPPAESEAPGTEINRFTKTKKL
jgi:hypothetical protein